MSLQDILGTELAIIQAPMAGVQLASMAVAVSNAGALGSLPAAMLSPDRLRIELEAVRDGTKFPFNVNFFCHTEPPRDVDREQRWRSVLKPYFDEFGVDLETTAESASRTPFSSDIADVVEPFKPPVVSFHFGLPAPELLRRVRSWGSKILASATTVAEALWLQANGVDAIIAQGWEAGGHRGMFLSDDVATQLGTFALVPQIVNATNKPVIAAGGIADADGVSAALDLGAGAVQIGTAFLLCDEATTSSIHRSALEDQDARETAVTNVFTGRPARGIVNRAMRELGYMNSMVPQFPLGAPAIAPLRAAAERAGKGDFSPLWCGQNATGCKALPSADVVQLLTPDGHAAFAKRPDTR